MKVKCDCGSSYFLKVVTADYEDDLLVRHGGLMCVNCKKVYTMAELRAEKAANINSNEFVLSKWHD